MRDSVLRDSLRLQLLLRDLALFLGPELLRDELEDRTPEVAVGPLALGEGEAQVKQSFRRDQDGFLLELLEQVESFIARELQEMAEGVSRVAARVRRIEPLLPELGDPHREVALGRREVVVLDQAQHAL